MTADLPALIAAVRRELDAVDAEVGRYEDDPRSFHARHRAAIGDLAARLTEAHGARISERWDGGRVRLAGIASTSTSDVAGALRNWLAAATRRLPAEGSR